MLLTNLLLHHAVGHDPGRKPVDEIVMFKVLVLQALYDLSDDAAEYQCGFRFDRAHYSDLMPRSVPI